MELPQGVSKHYTTPPTEDCTLVHKEKILTCFVYIFICFHDTLGVFVLPCGISEQCPRGIYVLIGKTTMNLSPSGHTDVGSYFGHSVEVRNQGGVS